MNTKVPTDSWMSLLTHGELIYNPEQQQPQPPQLLV